MFATAIRTLNAYGSWANACHSTFPRTSSGRRQDAHEPVDEPRIFAATVSSSSRLGLAEKSATI